MYVLQRIAQSLQQALWRLANHKTHSVYVVA